MTLRHFDELNTARLNIVVMCHIIPTQIQQANEVTISDPTHKVVNTDLVCKVVV